MDCYSLELINSKINEIVVQKNQYISDKEDKSAHGIGISSIRDIVEKYEMVGKVEWISFSSDLLRMVAQYDQTDMLGFLAGSKSDVSDIQSNVKAMKEDGCNVFLDVHYAAQMSYLDFCKENDIPLELWGINSIDVMNTLDGYITGVTTDTIRN